MKLTPVIGLEVHVELKTKSKMFCRCSAYYFGEEPNTHTCPVCLGLPGALPVPNKKAIDWCVMIGQALLCTIPLHAKFDRKNYFYPDLAKGYQISQYDQPFAQNGVLVLESGKKIRIRRVHMEEDTGKLIHATLSDHEASLIDFNRSGVPLVEIVTEPDFENAREVKEYLQKLQQIVRYLDVSSADMEKGEMRLEPNISLRQDTSTGLPPYKVEVKNINSFNFVEDAINYEIKRQTELLIKKEIPIQETRGWHEAKKKTVSQRTKEEAQDYRYFPEPDIPPIQWTADSIAESKAKIPELADQKRNRFITAYGISSYNAEILTRDKTTAEYFEEAIADNAALIKKKHPATDAKTIANWIINKKVAIASVVPAALLKEIISSANVSGMTDAELQTILQRIVASNEKAVVDFKNGKKNALMFLLGQTMQEVKGKVKADQVLEKLNALLSAHQQKN